jgi:hypothetical protein
MRETAAGPLRGRCFTIRFNLTRLVPVRASRPRPQDAQLRPAASPAATPGHPRLLDIHPEMAAGDNQPQDLPLWPELELRRSPSLLEKEGTYGAATNGCGTHMFGSYPFGVARFLCRS